MGIAAGMLVAVIGAFLVWGVQDVGTFGWILLVLGAAATLVAVAVRTARGGP
jgi:hypothetical protein